ncbi:uncharacterized protein LOC105426685 [Pogonomyrmex barbatus]|uniref:Uncharacterized protein LOC105426685 n=1 Tax=Pogonomyrmex barbatus TaxID=144034 RepID=A0A8N1S4S7_9HYME|nr:uncharacterized protein LOC105426685 [Pogonomyrmex barbatus]
MNGTAALRRSVGAGAGAISGGAIEPAPIATLVVYKDDAGFGMKVSGDNPVYVQSVKEGGAAARAGLHAGDKIIKVNGVNVMQSTHTDVVQLIKSTFFMDFSRTTAVETEIIRMKLYHKEANETIAAITTVTTATTTTTSGLQVGVIGATNQQHQRPVSLSASGNMSPSQPATSLHRASTAPAGGAPCNTRITGPQPVDLEKKRQLETQRVHTFQLMLEKEQSYVDKLRSELAKGGTSSGNVNITAIQGELAGAERRVRTLQEQLAAISSTNEQLCSLVTNTLCSSGYCPSSNNGSGADVPPPLPSRKSLSMQSLSPPPLPPRPSPATQNTVQPELDRHLLIHLTPSTINQSISNSVSNIISNIVQYCYIYIYFIFILRLLINIYMLENFREDVEKEHVDLRLFTTAAGLATILIKIFQLRPVWADRVPTFVAKDKSNIKARLLTGKTRKMTIRGHHFVAHQYFTITYCNHCQLIIGGIGPQGYLCSDCSLSVHRQCVRVVEENCPGPLVRKERTNDRISKLMERIRPERKFPSSHHHLQNHTSHCYEIREKVVTYTGTSYILNYLKYFLYFVCLFLQKFFFICYFLYTNRVQQNITSKPKTSNINRSESYKERIHHKRQLREKRKTSDPNLSKTKVGSSDCEPSGIFPGNSAGSSSNSSLSTRSLDSPSTSLEQVHPTSSVTNASTSWDSDVDVEADPPDWTQAVPEDVLAQLSNSEKKRQDVINELFHTERSHVRALKVLSHVFHKPLLESQVLPLDQIQLLFSNLDEMLMIHSRFNQAMKRKKKENPCVSDVGDLLLEMFDGEAGEVFEKAASTYCAKQQVALDALRDRRRKDSKLNTFLNEVEANPLCRRLQLKDHILTGMLRLTKYPLLFENLAKYTPDNNEKEKIAVLRSLERSKEILSRVNQAVKEAEDHQRLTEIQRAIDRSAFDKFDDPTVQEFKNLDITKRKLIYEGPLQWRRTELNRSMPNRSVPKPVDLHVVLLDDTILFLHRQDDKYLLKFINTTNQAGNSVLSPIVKLSTVLVRHNAAEKDSLYLVNTSQDGAQMYNLVAPSSAERKLWCKHISEAVEAYKTRDRQGRRPTPSATLPEEPTHMEDASSSGLEADGITIEKDQDQESRELGQNVINMQEHNEETTTTETPSIGQTQQRIQSTESSTTGMTEPLRMITCTQLSLIDPLEVHVEVPPVHVAEPILTPIADQLVGMLNSALNISETETIFSSRGATLSSPACESTGCPLLRSHSHPQQSITKMIQPIRLYLTTQLSQLSQLLEIIKEREEEREKLRKELHRSRERIHALNTDVQRREFSEMITTTTCTQTMLDDLVHQDNCTNDFAHHDFIDTDRETIADEDMENLELKAETEMMGDSVG